MSEAPANTEPAAAAQPHRRSDVGQIALLLGGAIAVGAIAQLFIRPGAVAASIATLVLSVGLIAASLVARGRLLRAVSGFPLAAATLILLANAAMLGTLILQNKGPDDYRTHYGFLAPLILTLRLDDIFHSLWLAGLLSLTVCGLVTSAVQRWPLTARNVGFFAVHLGIVVVLAGTGLSACFSAKGIIDLHVGEAPATTVQLLRNGKLTGELAALGASVQLDRFDVDRYREQYRVVLYKPAKEHGWDLVRSYEAKLGEPQRLPDGTTFRVKDQWPDFAIEERLVEAPQDGAPGLELSIDGSKTALAQGERTRIRSSDGKVLVLFGWQRPELPRPGATHTISFEGGEAQPIEVGQTIELPDGTPLKALQFLPHFTYDIEAKEARSLSDEPVNPALQVQIGGEDGPKRWLFANMPGHDHGKGGPKLVYVYSSGQESAPTTIAVGGSDKSVLVRRGEKVETLALTDGLEIDGVRFGRLLAQARLERKPTSKSSELKNPAVMLELTEDGEPQQKLLIARERDGIGLKSGYVVTYEARGDEVKSFRSHVTVTRGEQRSQGIIAVNEPLKVGRWQLYQVNYDPNDPDYSGLDAVRDPGVDWVFAGFGLLLLGTVYMIYVQPRLRRREA